MTYDDRWTEEAEVVEIAALTLDDELFPRERLDPETVDEYAERMQEEGERFPAIRAIKFQSGPLMLVDGWHRVEAARRLGYTKLHARVRPGGWVEAVEAAAASNGRHGRARTNADKRKAVSILLDLPKWAEASDREIAKHCMVSHPFVADVRAIRNPSTTLDPAPISQTRPTNGNSSTIDDPLDPEEGTRQRESMVESRPEPYRAPWPTMEKLAAPVPITYRDILAWLATEPDSERRRLSDDAFDFIVSAEERLKHDEKVRAWLAKHERGDAWDTTTTGDDA
jgi:hypothetical protein